MASASKMRRTDAHAFGIPRARLRGAAREALSSAGVFSGRFNRARQGPLEPYNPAEEIPITNVLGHDKQRILVRRALWSFTLPRSASSASIPYPGTWRQMTSHLQGCDQREVDVGAARILSAHPPRRKGKTIVDSSKPTSPPCAFIHTTTFATCPLPPPQNPVTDSVS